MKRFNSFFSSSFSALFFSCLLFFSFLFYFVRILCLNLFFIVTPWHNLFSQSLSLVFQIVLEMRGWTRPLCTRQWIHTIEAPVMIWKSNISFLIDYYWCCSWGYNSSSPQSYSQLEFLFTRPTENGRWSCADYDNSESRSKRSLLNLRISPGPT